MHTCAGSRVAILTHAECAAAAAAFRTACGEDHLEAQGSDAVEDSHWAGTKGCHVSRWVKNNNWVSRHNIAGIWVAFFLRCQRYRCRQVDYAVEIGLSDPERLVVGGWSCASLF